MGDQADRLVEELWYVAESGEPIQDDRQQLVGSQIWRSSDGTETPYTKLEKSHLLNILLFLRDTRLRDLQKEATKAGVLISPEDLWENNKPVEWFDLFEEAERRGGMVALAAQRIDDGMAAELIRTNVRDGRKSS